MNKESNVNYELTKTKPILETEISETKECPECDSTRLMHDYEFAEIVCMNCGFVVNQKNAEKKTVLQKVNEEKKSKHTKIGACLTFTIHTKGSTTIIDWHNQNKHSKNFSINQKTQIYRLRNWQRRIKATGSAERNLTYALTEITKTANNLDIPKNVLETATVIYRKAVKERLINGRSIQCIATASLYLACRQCGHPKTFNDIAYTSTVNKKKLGKDYRFLIKRLNYSTPPLQPNQYVAKFSNKKLSQEKIEEITHKILVAAKDNKLTAGRSPIGIAAAASYIALILIDERKTQKEIADIAQTTETTIKNRYKELVNRLMFEISL